MFLLFQTKDPVFDEHEFMFHSIVKTVRSFVKDVDGFLSGMQEQFSSQLQISSSIVNFYQDRKSEVEDYHRLQQLICKRFLEEFVSYFFIRIENLKWKITIGTTANMQEILGVIFKLFFIDFEKCILT